MQWRSLLGAGLWKYETLLVQCSSSACCVWRFHHFPILPHPKIGPSMFRKTTMGGTDVLLCTCTGRTRCISEVRTDKRNTCRQTSEQSGKQPRKILSVFIICQNSLVLSNQWRQLMLLVDNEHSLGEWCTYVDQVNTKTTPRLDWN